MGWDTDNCIQQRNIPGGRKPGPMRAHFNGRPTKLSYGSPEWLSPTFGSSAVHSHEVKIMGHHPVHIIVVVEGYARRIHSAAIQQVGPGMGTGKINRLPAGFREVSRISGIHTQRPVALWARTRASGVLRSGRQLTVRAIAE